MEINSFPSWNVEQFTRALDLMNRSVAAGNQAFVNPPPLPPPMLNPVMAPLAPPVVLDETRVSQGFRELVEYQCAQEGILFVPLVNRWQAGRPVFRVGNVLSYFDRQVRVIFTFRILLLRWIPLMRIDWILYRMCSWWLQTECGSLFYRSSLLIWQ